MYTDPFYLEDHEVDDIYCKGDECRNADLGWWSRKGKYRIGNRYYGMVRLGKRFENATAGLFTCHYEGDRPVSVHIFESEFYTAFYANIL